jgi:manganese/zinc/iron transport system permease protein
MIAFIPYNTAVVLLGASLLGLCAGVIGCFALLRRRSLVGDALSHATLPGVCLAYLIVGERSLPALLAGAAVAGLAGVGVLALLDRYTRIKQDAGIAIVLSTFFGAGVVLQVIIQQRPGSGRAGLDAFIFGRTAGMIAEDVKLIAWLALATVLVVTLLYKEFKLVSFDPQFARGQGWPAAAIDLGMMLLLVVAVVIGLPAVGVLMIAGLLVIPAAAARFWTDRLGVMLILAGGVGLAAGVAGTWISATVERMPAGPTIILVATALFVLSLALAPRRGVLARWLRGRRDRLALEPPPPVHEEAVP